MIGFDVKVENGEIVRMGLQSLADDVPKIGRLQIYYTVLKVRTRMRAPYTSVGAVPGYVRTRRLFHAWTIERKPEGYAIWADPKTPYGRPYAQYVVGDAEGHGQAWMHEGRWPLFREVVDEEVGKLPPEVERHIEVTARSHGL